MDGFWNGFLEYFLKSCIFVAAGKTLRITLLKVKTSVYWFSKEQKLTSISFKSTIRTLISPLSNSPSKNSHQT
eukprot:snap_masked-scaffold_30-processed-gene-0.22-mRNA-1 protein AED:1.00 eAED:1.00 QI:0/0/0/0/1/1/2/0/72